MTRTRVLAVLSLAAVTGLTACGGSSAKSSPSTTAGRTSSTTAEPGTTSSTATATPQACELVSKEQADTVLGTTLLDGLAVDNSDVNSCTYPGDPNGPTAQFEIFVGPGAKKNYDIDNDTLHHTFTDVPGLGDEAHEEEYELFFRKGATWVALRVTSLDPWSTFQPRAEALAQEVVAEL